MGMQKSSKLGFCYFTESSLLIFALHPPYGKNQKVDRFIKRLQRKIKLFPRHILLSISASTGRVKDHATVYVIDCDGVLFLSQKLLNCNNTDVRSEAAIINLNRPGLFIVEDEISV